MPSSSDTSSDNSQSDSDEDVATVELQRIRAAQAAADELSSTDEDSDVAELTKKQLNGDDEEQEDDSSSDEDDSSSSSDDGGDDSEADAAENVSSGIARARARANMGDDDGATTSESEGEDGDEDEDEEAGTTLDPAVARARARASMGDAGDASTSSDDDDSDGAGGGGRASGGGNKAVVGPASDSDDESQGQGGKNDSSSDSDSDSDSNSNSSEEEEEEEEESSDEAGAEVSLEELQEMKRDGKEYKLSQEGKKRVKKLANKKFARPNKNAPQVASSKIRVSRFREVVPGKKVVRRDPRFSDVSGSFNDSYFRQSYKFLESYQESEIAEIRKQLKKSKKVSEAQRRDMQASLTKLQQMRSSWRKRETRDAVHSEVRKANRDKIKKGQTPFFPSKRSLKESVATREYEYLTKNKGKLVDTIMKKKRRKLNKHSHGQKPGRF